ncbi:MAG: transglycosylase SLT domain-containing protein [Sphingobacteriaceae bacterium]|nr:transglycosylase SLT domain-containing protein [Sphingobacteriaceae bacterium]
MKSKALLSVLLLLQIVLQSVSAAALPSKLSLLPDSISVFSASNHQVDLDKNLGRDSVKQVVPKTFNLAVSQYIEALTKRKEQVGKMLGLSNYYFPVYEKVFKEFGLPEELKFLSVVESALNPHAVSRVGATGPWQFMFGTAKAYGLTMNKDVDERKDPVQASKAAAAYLKDAFAQFDDWLLAIASYNCGKGAVARAIVKAGGKADFWAISPYLPAETRNYVPKFIATAYIMSNYQNYGISPLSPGFNTLTDVFDVVKPVSLAAVARATGIDLQELMLLNPSYKKLMVKGSPAAPKSVVIPIQNQPDYAVLYQVLNGTAAGVGVVAPKASTSTKVSYYTVKRGDNLSSIAKKYVGLSASQLKSWNKLQSNALKVGMRLKIVQQ